MARQIAGRRECRINQYGIRQTGRPFLNWMRTEGGAEATLGPLEGLGGDAKGLGSAIWVNDR